MKTALKKLSQHTAVYGIGHILTRSIGFLLLPIHTNYILPDAFGVASLLFSSLAIMNVIFSYGMDTAFLRYFVLSDSKEEKRAVFSTAFSMIFITGGLFAACLLLFPETFSQWIFRSGEYTTLIRLAAGILYADALALLPFLVLRGEEKPVAFASLKFINVILNFSLNILLIIVLKKGIFGIFLSNLLASLATLIILLPVLIHWFRFRFSSSLLKQLLQFGLPYVPSGLAVIIMDQIGRFFLDRMDGQAATGIFSASYKLGMFMALIVAAFRFAWHPFFLSTSKQADAEKIFARVFTYFLAITGVLFLFISLFIDQIIRIRIFGFQIYGEAFISGKGIVPIILLAYIAYGAYVNFIVGVYLKKKTQVLPFITGVGALVSILINAFGIPIWGMNAAAWATFFAYFSMAVSLYFVSKNLYRIHYEWKRIFTLCIVIGGLYGIGQAIGIPALRLLIFPALPVSLWALRFWHEDEKRLFSRFRRNLKI